MACRLTKEQIFDVIGLLAINLKSIVNDPEAPVFNMESFMMKIYNAIEDKEKALVYVEAVPVIIEKVKTADYEIRKYFIKNNLNEKLENFIVDFEELDNVLKFVENQGKSKKTPEDVDKEIERYNKTKENIPILNPEELDESEIAEAQNSAKVLYPLSLTGQFAYIVNPKTASEEIKNTRDPEKTMMYNVIKDIVYLTRSVDSDNPEIIYQDTEIKLGLQNIQVVDRSLLTKEDQLRLRNNPGARAIVAFLTDTEGNILYFDEGGALTTKSSGKPVYQFLRKVVKKDGGLVFENSEGFYSTPVEAENIAKRELERAGIDATKKQLANKTIEVAIRQEQEMNQLYNLSKHLEKNPNTVPIVSIVNGSYGAVDTKFIPLAETAIEEKDVAKAELIEVGNNRGKYEFTIKSEKPSVTVEDEVLTQRGDINDDLADKIATILTTTATLNGKPLTVEQRLTYYKVFLSNAIEKNRIQVYETEIDGEKALTVEIAGEEIDQEDLYTKASKKLIKEHLLKAKEIKKRNGDIATYPADINYNNDYFRGDFTDYEVEGDKITEIKNVNYFNFIKPFIKIEYSKDSLAYFAGANAYLEFSLPEDIAPAGEISETLKGEKSKIKKKKSKEPSKRPKNPDAAEISLTTKMQSFDSTIEQNIEDSDMTIAFQLKGINSNPRIGDAKKLADVFKSFTLNIKNKQASPSDTLVKNFVQALNDNEVSTLNLVASNLYELNQKKINQDTIDDYIYELLEKVVNSPDLAQSIESVILTGETGVEEAFAKAASELGIPVQINALQFYTHVRPRKTGQGYYYVKGKKAFAKRFGITVKGKSKTKTRKAKKVTKAKGSTKAKALPKTIAPVPITDLISSNQSSFLDRSKTMSSFLDRVFTTKADKRKAEEWWDNTFGKVLGKEYLTRVTEVVNSDAFATFVEKGVILYEADGGTTVDLYHEAYHVFSQLFLTKEDKIDLYDTVAKLGKYQNRTYEDVMDLYRDIEEDLAEDYRSYMKFKKKFPGIVGRIFAKMGTFLRKMFSKVTRKDFTRPRDIPRVKELYYQLYRADKNPEILQNLKPSTKNVIFGKLNRSKDTIGLTKENVDKSPEFSIEESQKAKDLLDSALVAQIQTANLGKKFASVNSILTNPANRKIFYTQIAEGIKQQIQDVAAALQDLSPRLIEEETPSIEDIQLEKELTERLNLLIKIQDNYGDIGLSLSGKQKSGVVAYHLDNSAFKLLQESFEEDEDDDPTNIQESRIFKDSGGNLVSSKKVASLDTLSLLTAVFKVKEVVDGKPVYDVDPYGYRKLQPLDITWKRLAKILEGSFDYTEMYGRLLEQAENYPEFYQLLQLLPNPANGVNSQAVFKTETSFWQDLKKPRLKYIQLRIDKEYENKKAVYKSTLARTEYDVFRVISDWSANTTLADAESNKYITTDEYGRNMLDTAKIIKDFSVKGKFNKKKALEFLAALGIELDTTSHTIKLIATDPVYNFSKIFKVERIFEMVKRVNAVPENASDQMLADATNFKVNPIEYLRKGLPSSLKVKDEKQTDVDSAVRKLARLQMLYSDSYSNFSVTNPEGSRVWEHFLDSTITRIVTSINKAKSWQELTGMENADPNKRFQHMYWLSEANNTMSTFSKLLNSIFYLNVPMTDTRYGNKKKNAKLLLQNVAGTQLVTKNSSQSNIGSLTASTDVTSKFLQELNTMLLNGVEEFMRHASKNTAMGITTATTPIETYDGKVKDKLYIDIEAFRPTSNNYGEQRGTEIVKDYLAGEANRIFRFLKNEKQFANYAAYNKEVVRKDGKTTKAGAAFTIFDDMLTKEVQEELYDLIEDSVKNNRDFNLADIFKDNLDLSIKVENDLIEYFNLDTQDNLDRLLKNPYVNEGILQNIDNGSLSDAQIYETVAKAYTYNTFIHKFETIILAYGDAVQYNHVKEEFHKRNAGLAAGGRSFRADLRAQAFINSINFGAAYTVSEGYKRRAYDGTLHTGIIKEDEIESIYYDEYFKILEKDIYDRIKDKKKAKELATKAMEEYKKMAVGDGQGYINLDSYRMLKNLEDNWSKEQERLYQKIVNKEQVSAEDIIEYFPPYKVQYFGNIKAEGLPVNSFHKFSLMPLIPGFVMENTALEQLNKDMMDQQLDYVLFESGSKVNQLGDGTAVLDKDGNYTTKTFTKNIIFAEYLKNQTEVNKQYKGVSIFSTQMRKLVLEGLFEKGVIATKDESKVVNNLVKKYLDDVSEYTELVKLELLTEIGFREVKGSYEPINKESTTKLVELVRNNLKREDILGDDLLQIIDTDENGNVLYDLSLHPEAEKIEKLLLSLINKRVIKQKVKGEPLVQVASSMLAGGFTTPLQKLKKATNKEIKKYAGSNFLPNYQKNADGTTAAAKVMIALQGDYENLLNLMYDENSTIAVYDEEGNILMNESLERLNEKIKDDAWLDANDQNARKAITLVGARIPVQGLNSMEFFEVYHFLPPQAGNIIVPPAEIVAKSGADFDIDKLTMFMTNIDSDGKTSKKFSASMEEFEEELNTLLELEENTDFLFEMQKAGLENELIDDMRNILALPQNFVSLIKPNGIYLLKDIADDLAQYVMDYNPLKNKMTQENVTPLDEDGKQKRIISPTRIIEAGYNLYKHESNVVGKKTLGLGAIENTFHSLINSLNIPGGATMPNSYFHVSGVKKQLRMSRLFLKHNSVVKNGKEVISIASRYDANNENKIADIISQMMNGWVDVEKDAWIFFIQGNYEVAPVLLYLIKTGVPVKDAIYFVSQPLVRKYVEEQRLAKSTFADVLGKKPSSLGLVRHVSANNVLAKYIDPKLQKLKTFARYDLFESSQTEFFEDREKSEFTTDEMYQLIKDFKTDEEVAGSDLSKTMFLHYLTIEQQISGLTKLKMNTNPDTSTKSNIYAVEETEANLDELLYESKIDQDLLKALETDSVISSFFNGKLALDLSKTLFQLRFHPEITSFLIQNKNQLYDLAKETFGESQKELFVKTFRNDLVSYIFQNAVRKYKMGESYKSYTLKETVPVKLAKELKKTGAFAVKDASGNVVMYVDRKQIKKDYDKKLWAKDTDEPNSYLNRGLYAVDYGVFLKDKNEGRAEFLNFVIERELLRSIYSFEEVLQRPSVKADLLLDEIKDLSKEKKARYVYEKFIAERALENLLNPHQLFENKESAYAVKLNNILLKNKNLKSEYEVLNWLTLDSNSKNTVFNIFFGDKDLTSTTSNLYRKNLKDLADITVIKSSDPQENLEISEFFRLLPLVGFMQTGFNNTKYNLMKVLDMSDFLSMMTQESKKFINALESNPETVMEEYMASFMTVNSSYNYTKNNFKDYLSKLKLEVVDEETKRVGISTTSRENIYEFNDSNWNNDKYKTVSKDNSDVAMVYSIPILGLKEDTLKVFGGQSALHYADSAGNISLPTDMLKKNDNMQDLSPDKFNSIKGLWERRIDEMKARLEQNLPIAFSTVGYGDPKLMPEELFVYLSKRLYEEFGYLNPGSLEFDSFNELVKSVEPITDEEIEIMMELEEDPFKCK